ncbi:transmembrane 4 L6 family member 18 [Microcaecilia unicolor]|uniref:Transmembrane 4 L6 family member 18 n=1 Tax=Microcaecilia unicolor TaxID=1415580 RepID=A0A6P7Z7Y5_9AMPH|nr:transmembrane 4 L6 family member 18 [Microcaecilia unicolor]
MCLKYISDWLSFTLLPLAIWSIAVHLLLYFPNGETTYASNNQLTNYVWYFEGLCFSGVMMLLIATVLLTVENYNCYTFSSLQHKYWSQRYSRLGSPILALLGVAFSGYCLIISSLGLAQGPFCSTLAGWDYPFKDTAGSYLTNSSSWAQCLEPAQIVQWNIILFSILIALSGLQVIICFLKGTMELKRILCGTHSFIIQPDTF